MILLGRLEFELHEDATHMTFNGLSLKCNAEPIAELDRRSAISFQALTLSIGETGDQVSPRRRETSSATTSGSIAEPPDATRRTASVNSPTSDTRSFSWYPIRPAPRSSSLSAWVVSTYCDRSNTAPDGAASNVLSLRCIIICKCGNCEIDPSFPLATATAPVKVIKPKSARATGSPPHKSLDHYYFP